MDETEERIARGKRLAALRDELDLTVVVLAVRLNDVARQLDLPQRWTGPKISKIEVGSQNFVIEDVACLAAYDPHERGWFWWYFGREQKVVARAKIANGAPKLELRKPQRPYVPRSNTTGKGKP